MVKNVSRKWYRDLLSKGRNANGPSWAAHSLEQRAACVNLWEGWGAASGAERALLKCTSKEALNCRVNS